ncbi:MAG TPA: hypothetical protein DEB30_00885 [Candidatus Peribacter riflensis]|uniref:Uncharacterized protein n=1 Tax=Candidatus Peribacter riflensis TaxID=1735162 RepID=A0A0S1SNR7_9BACT|nr:MAG: hypothetical protein PeribacterA2_0340 [Candidatus Peribacter riflensis]OGJ78304.1 MAG: hypothetical protein A2398_05465 [Candidatus Peribacteria bacterium RIFOXYB1_FULL_57_12]OGJ82375.1 MAG: hypothetical protein A2412_03650 [Candidatus Peribacteria bacterium RIFOXYC1_FULL_58_8]ALM10833.1 MAG: hypothetical protein PeribacterB2_0340 [Candidatus Peribacter riflensis]ALM11935.1 MAG: hypothetical protein PeribacterC2_0339 [Candidatus Peribacter riflensis]
MRLLHDLEQEARRTNDASYQESMIEKLRSQLPDKMRRLLDMHMRVTDRRLAHRYPGDPEKTVRVSKAIRSKTTRDVHAENLYDSILSTPEFPIHSKAYGSSLMNRHLATMAIDRAPPSMLETYGWMSFDMNGVKGMVDCTTYQNVTHYLQATAQFLLDREGQTRKWLESRKVKVTPLAAGGDEFALLLDGDGPMSAGFFQETVSRYQAEFANSRHLASFLDFNSRSVQLEYSMPTESQRAVFFGMSQAEQDKHLDDVHNELPETFYSTCGAGGANFREGLERAVGRGTLSLKKGKETFDTGRLAILRHTIELAEARQADNKVEFKKCLELGDPKLHCFLRRNNENRNLDGRLREAELQLAQERLRRADMERDLDALHALCSEKNSQIEELLKKCA